MTAGTQGTGGRLINDVCSLAKVALSQGCGTNHRIQTITLNTNSSQGKSAGYPRKRWCQLKRPLRTLLVLEQIEFMLW